MLLPCLLYIHVIFNYWYDYFCSLHPQPCLQSYADTLTIGSESVTKLNDGSSKIGCSLSKEQSTQLWIQIQQVYNHLCWSVMSVLYDTKVSSCNYIHYFVRSISSFWCKHLFWWGMNLLCSFSPKLQLKPL